MTTDQGAEQMLKRCPRGPDNFYNPIRAPQGLIAVRANSRNQLMNQLIDGRCKEGDLPQSL
jgi:hypothetical protein